MDVIEPIFSISSKIYDLVEKVKANKKRCRRVSKRVKSLVQVVESIRDRGATVTSADVTKSLQELCGTLRSAQILIEKYTMAKWIERILKSGSHGDEFDEVHNRLDDAFQVLSLSLQVEQRNLLYKEFKLSTKQRDQDKKEDRQELQKCESRQFGLSRQDSVSLLVLVDFCSFLSLRELLVSIRLFR